MSRRQPWMKWYPADWRADPGLRMCGYAARGLWADMLALMHDAEPYGHLVVNGVAPSLQQIAAMLGGTTAEVGRLVAELDAAGVFSRTGTGTIYSRRMVRDKAKADADADNGKRGGNPRLKGKQNPPDNGGVNPQVVDGDKAQKPEARSQITAAVGNSAPEPSPPEPAGPVAAADPILGLQAKCLAVLGLEPHTAPPGLASAATMRGWLDGGATAADVIDAVTAAAGRQRAKAPNWLPGSWSYFAKPVAEARQARETGAQGASYSAPPPVDAAGKLNAPGRWYDGMTLAERDAEVARRKEADEAEQRRVRDAAAERERVRIAALDDIPAFMDKRPARLPVAADVEEVE